MLLQNLQECTVPTKQVIQKRKNAGLCASCGKLPPKKDRVSCHRRQKRDIVFNAYGGKKCNCCGEEEVLFLTIDHINNNGAKHRKEICKSGKASGTAIHLWLIKNNFPKGFQVLCANCRLGKHLNGGICPHKDHIMIN